MSLTQIYQGESIGITLHSELPLDDWSVTAELFTSAADYRIVGACPDREGFLSIENEGQTLKMQIPPAECAKLSEGILSLHITLACDHAVKKGTIRLADILSARTTATQRTSVEQQLVFMDNDIQLSLDMGPKVSDDGFSPIVSILEDAHSTRLEITDAVGVKRTGNLRTPANLVSGPGDREDAAMTQKSTTEFMTRTVAETLSGANAYTDKRIAALPTPDVSGQIAEHNASGAAHGDIREEVRQTAGRFGDYYDKTQTDAQLAAKVTAVPGKGLSTHDYTSAEKSEVAKIADKVDKVAGKGLSTHDYDDAAQAEVAKIAGKADAEKTYTTVVNTPEWTAQPTIGGALDGAFVAYPEDYYFVTLRTADGQALPAGQFRLTPALDAAYAADPAKAIDQTFTLAGLDTGNSGKLAESTPVDFTAVGDGWRLRSGGVTTIKIDIDEQYRQGYDLNIYSVSKVFKGGLSYYSPFISMGISNYYFAMAGLGYGYDFANQFLMGPPSWANARKHSFSNEVFRVRMLSTTCLVEYSRNMMGFDGTPANRTAIVNNSADGFRINAVGFSLDESRYPVSALTLRPEISMPSAYIRRNGSSIRIELIKRT